MSLSGKNGISISLYFERKIVVLLEMALLVYSYLIITVGGCDSPTPFVKLKLLISRFQSTGKAAPEIIPFL